MQGADKKGVPYVPVSNLMGGYYQIYRRFFFIFGAAAIFMLASWLGAPQWLAIVAAGLSIGPLFRLEQLYAQWQFEKSQ